MRTLYPILVVAALGTATLIWGISGIGTLYTNNDPVSGESQSADRLQEQANSSAAAEDGSFEASARGGGSDNIVGLVIAGVQSIVSFATMVALLPFELQRLGFPRYFAYPIGVLAQSLVGIGIVQFASGRFYR
jgi:hypothetical protein